MTGTAAADWGLCTTLKAPPDQVLAFVAHHLSLGCARMWLFFDDPDDPAADVVAHQPRVTVTRCDDAHWRRIKGKRPEKHQNRQGRNMQSVYAGSPLPWIAHVDVDEFLLPARDIGTLLAGLHPDLAMLPMGPWEALHDPALPDDIFTANRFRKALSGDALTALRARVFGPYAALLPKGVLSHSAGKCFFRTGIPGLEPRLHGAFFEGRRLPGGSFSPDVALLHFHAQDPAAWLDRLQFRLTRGAYQFNPALAEWLAAADDGAIRAFYAQVQTVSPATLATLRGAGALIEADLGLRALVRDRFPDQTGHTAKG
ncbi:MAG: glycosyltransferase family 2 protein [Gemmobacter sp.]